MLEAQKNLPIIILVEPQLSENIGMTARAMANFGLGQLRLVTPIQAFPCEKAYSTAKKAHHVINNTQVFDNFIDAVKDLDYLFATTARQRASFKSVYSPIQAVERMQPALHMGQKIGILFGRERFGLSNEEISFADEIITFPVDEQVSSLNIAQSVLLLAYEVRKATFANKKATVFSGPEHIPAEKTVLYGLFQQLEEALACRGYFRSAGRTEIMKHNLRDVFSRAKFSKEEIALLRGVIASLDKYQPLDREND